MIRPIPIFYLHVCPIEYTYIMYTLRLDKFLLLTDEHNQQCQKFDIPRLKAMIA